ncbi:MAG: hypothetical protein RL026_1783 [Pseudomonadota bacterium]|jgi:ribosome-associated protein
MHDTDDGTWDRPSKSSRKRDAEALQALGVYLTTLRDEQLQGLPLPDALREAVIEARRIRNGPALARHRQYIGKLMRGIDVAPLEAALEALTVAHNARARLPR